MRRLLVLTVASVVLGLQVPIAGATAPSGIKGTVMKSPTRPVCEEGMSCSAPAVGVELVVLRGGVRVAGARTTQAGTYRILLPAGTYVVRTLRKAPFGSPPGRTVRVRPGRFVVASFEIDTGIR